MVDQMIKVGEHGWVSVCVCVWRQWAGLGGIVGSARSVAYVQNVSKPSPRLKCPSHLRQYDLDKKQSF